MHGVARSHLMNAPSRPLPTSITAHPPHPAPVSRAPRAPCARARPTSSSSSGQEHSYLSRHEACDAFISSPSCDRTSWPGAPDAHTRLQTKHQEGAG